MRSVFLSEGPRACRALKSLARKLRTDQFMSAYFQRQTACPTRGIPSLPFRNVVKLRLLFDMDSLLAAQRLAKIDQFEGCGSPPRREPGDGGARRDARCSPPCPDHARRPPALRRA